ncbi:MAG TPA: radical SAM family heme chaperone HemW [Longilinea sp.]|nr:radical SAM family heme chaperone HemW [Longilinea sp.]
MEPISLYLHIPFCIQRCGYCDFNTYAGMKKFLPAYTSALANEIKRVSLASNERLPVHTVFFGGGTPSLLSIRQLESILETIHECFDLAPDAEISMEANPGTLSLDWLMTARTLGVNRLSYGVQSSLDKELALLGRIHNQSDVIHSIDWAHSAGFDNLNLDLIFGLPIQSLADWQQTVQWAVDLHPQHLSLYNLTIEEGTPLESQINSGELPRPEDDLAADMYEWAMDHLSTVGMDQYEISNWSMPGKECRHNLQYWLGLPYLGFGAGAHGFAEGIRTENVPTIIDYIDRSGRQGEVPFPRTSTNLRTTTIDEKTQIEEFMMVGLRLVKQGVSRQRFQERFGINLDEVYGKTITRLIGVGLLEWGGDERDTLRLTRRGCFLGNQVFAEFLG